MDSRDVAPRNARLAALAAAAVTFVIVSGFVTLILMIEHARGSAIPRAGLLMTLAGAGLLAMGLTALLQPAGTFRALETTHEGARATPITSWMLRLTDSQYALFGYVAFSGVFTGLGAALLVAGLLQTYFY